MPSLNPYLSFKNDARAAMEFYQSVFGGDLDISTRSARTRAWCEDPSENDLVMHAQLDDPRRLHADGGRHPLAHGVRRSPPASRCRSAATTRRSSRASGTPSPTAVRSSCRSRCRRGADASGCCATSSASTGWSSYSPAALNIRSRARGIYWLPRQHGRTRERRRRVGCPVHTAAGRPAAADDEGRADVPRARRAPGRHRPHAQHLAGEGLAAAQACGIRRHRPHDGHRRARRVRRARGAARELGSGSPRRWSSTSIRMPTRARRSRRSARARRPTSRPPSAARDRIGVSSWSQTLLAMVDRMRPSPSPRADRGRAAARRHRRPRGAGPFAPPARRARAHARRRRRSMCMRPGIVAGPDIRDSLLEGPAMQEVARALART